MRLYLDTEWAAPESKQLASLALVDSTGRSRYYYESPAAIGAGAAAV